MSLRYGDRNDVLEVISKHPEGITAIDITTKMWPGRTGYDYTASKDWVKKQVQVLRTKGMIVGEPTEGKSYLWRVRV